MKIKLLCPVCDAEAVLRDAFASWNEETQEWELHSVYDSFSCNACGEEFSEPREEEMLEDGDLDGSPDHAGEAVQQEPAPPEGEN